MKTFLRLSIPQLTDLALDSFDYSLHLTTSKQPFLVSFVDASAIAAIRTRLKNCFPDELDTNSSKIFCCRLDCYKSGDLRNNACLLPNN